MKYHQLTERVRQADETHVVDPYVIDNKQHLLGYVELADLLRANAATPLSQLVHPCPNRVPAQALLDGLHDHRGWRESSILPVVDRDNRLVGAITHATLQRALSIDHHATPQGGSEDTLVDVASTYWFGVAALIQALVSLLPVERREEARGRIMNTGVESAVAALNLRYLLDCPREAARRIESMPAREVSAIG